MTFRKETLAEGVEVYHGLCQDVVPTLGHFDAVVTDQPYGTGWVRGGGKVGEFASAGEKPEWDVWDTSWISFCKADTFAAFCPSSRLRDLYNAFGGGQLRTYVKSNPRPALGGADAPSLEPIVVFPKVRFGSIQHFVAYNGNNEHHPTEKPVPLMEWLVEAVAAPGERVLDPFMGSGSTGVAAVRIGRRFTGVERDLAYFDTACRRITAALKEPSMFIEPVAPPKQTSMFSDEAA